MKRWLLGVGLLLANLANAQAEIITQWNFNSTTPDGNTGTGVSTPSVGSGSIAPVGGAAHPGFNSGVGSSDLASSDNSGFQTESYQSQGVGSGTRGIRLNVSTAGFAGISGSFDLRTSNTSSRWYQIRYTTDGSSFVNLGGPSRLGIGDITVGDAWSNNITFDLNSISAVNNNSQFGIEVVSVFSPDAFTEFLSGTSNAANTAYEAARNRSTGSQSNYAGGTWRFDMVTVNGVTAVPEPTSIALLSLVGVGGFALRRWRKGRAG